MKHNTCSSFHVSINDDVSDELLDVEPWPAGSLFRPFLGMLTPNSDAPRAETTVSGQPTGASPLGC